MIILSVILLLYVAVIIGLYILADNLGLAPKIQKGILITLPIIMFIVIVRVAINKKKLTAISLLFDLQATSVIALKTFADAQIRVHASATTKKDRKKSAIARKTFTQGKQGLSIAISNMAAA